MGWEKIPLNRLITNAETRLSKDKTNPELNYLLGRLYSYAFAYGMEKSFPVELERGANGFMYYLTIQPVKEAERTPVTDEELEYLEKSLQYYRKSLNRFNTPDKAYLGYAYIVEQAAGYAQRIGAVPGVTEKALSPKEWRLKAVALYRTIIKDYLKNDLKNTSRGMEVQDQFVSEEAAKSLIRLIKSGIGEFKVGEQKELLSALEKFNTMQRWITPLVIPVQPISTWDHRISQPGSATQFDLAGNGSGFTWPWIRPNYAFLVWDPEGSGQITSGRQLFGSGTFWMMFDNGFDALASLDDNLDGWVMGRELLGISVWHDRNGNAASDLGEVLPMQNYSITGLRCSFDYRSKEGLIANRGVLYSRGTSSDLIDWLPKSIPMP